MSICENLNNTLQIYDLKKKQYYEKKYILIEKNENTSAHTYQ